MTDTVRWRRASYSGTSGNCVELAHTGVAVRDSKRPTVTLPVAGLSAFVDQVKAARFDRR